VATGGQAVYAAPSRLHWKETATVSDASAMVQVPAAATWVTALVCGAVGATGGDGGGDGADGGELGSGSAGGLVGWVVG
jgi:hypothetical protein